VITVGRFSSFEVFNQVLIHEGFYDKVEQLLQRAGWEYLDTLATMTNLG
jgi:hypothetical protein